MYSLGGERVEGERRISGGKGRALFGVFLVFGGKRATFAMFYLFIYALIILV